VNALHPLLLHALFFAVLLALSYPLGAYLVQVLEGARTGAGGVALRLLAPLESAIYRICGIDRNEEMGWVRYTWAILLFSALGVLAVFLLQLAQQHLPLNPEGFAAVSADSAFNTAVSFVTNTDWQGYSGESTMSYLTQMLGLAVQNFFSAATGIAVVIALIRGFSRRETSRIGNAWVDLTRATLHVLLPLSTVFALFLVSQGVIQNFSGYRDVQTLEVTQFQNPVNDAQGNPAKDAQGNPVTQAAQTQVQRLPMGPIASQEAIKMLGTNGGGPFNANSAHPYENPTPLSNFAQMVSIFLIPAALVFAFGRMVGDTRQAWAIVAVMALLFVASAALAYFSERNGNPQLHALNVDQAAGAMQDGGNMEGKEARFGIADSTLFVTTTTAASCGAVNAMHDSLMPLGGFVPLWNMMLGEVVFGGVGSGLYGMLVFALLAVFVAGLMIGRTPEYLGKKIEAFDMKMISVAILVTPILVLLGTALAVISADGRAGIANPGPHGFSEILYAYTSAANNNGSAFAGLNANTVFYNLTTAVAMWFGRFGVVVPVLAIAGSLASKKRLAVTAGTMPTHGPLFVVLLLGTVVLVGALNFVPALALGPIIEHLQLATLH
jgi:potassium-transporting ATPase potassium-binding subunit